MKLSLRAKLTSVILALAALITIAVTVGSYIQMREQLINAGIRNEVGATAAGASALIKEWITTRKSIVAAGVQSAQTAEDPLAAIIQTAKSGNFQAAYLGTPDKQMIADHDMQLPAGYDPTARPWYKDNVNATGTVMTDPYIDMSTKKLVISFVEPVKKNGTFAGVLGTDVLLDDIVASVLGIKLVGEGYGMLLSKNGQVLVHRDAERITKPASDLAPELKPELLADLAKSGELREITLDNTSKYFYVHAIEGTDLYLALAVDKSLALAPLSALLWQALITLVVILLVVVPLTGLLVSTLLRSIRHIHDTMLEIANGGGDLTRKIEIEGNDEVAETAEAFNRFLDQLRSMFGRIDQESIELTTGVKDIHDVIEQLSDDTQRLADLTAENAAAIEEITVSISHIADSSQDVDKLTKDTDVLSLESVTAVRGVAEETRESARDVEALSTMLDGLSQRSQEISGIIRVIKEIADQTNLLALNAAIEAARAGEQGRGFAVVADEVRKLAERTAKSTQDITGMVDAVRNGARSAEEGMQIAVERVAAGVSLSSEVSDSINKISEGRHHTVAMVNEISGAISEQAVASTSSL